jgi:hypothetical protein
MNHEQDLAAGQDRGVSVAALAGGSIDLGHLRYLSVLSNAE